MNLLPPVVSEVPVNDDVRISDKWASVRTPDYRNDSMFDASLEFTSESLNHQVRWENLFPIGNPTRRKMNAPSSLNQTVTISQSPGQERYRVKIWEWNLKFLGEPNTMPVIEFLRRVKELAKPRGTNKFDLFKGAVDLFAASGLSWYRAGMDSQSLLNWDELKAQLLIDFEAHDYGENLLDYIRLQKPNEWIVNYFVSMEDLFLKLNRPVSELLKVNIIRKNLRPEFIRGLGCTGMTSII